MKSRSRRIPATAVRFVSANGPTHRRKPNLVFSDGEQNPAVRGNWPQVVTFACSPVLKIDHVLVMWERSVAGDQEGKIAALARFVVRDRRIESPVERLEHTVTMLQPSSMVRQGMPGDRTEGRNRRYFGKRWGELARFPAFQGCRRGCACTTLLRGWPR
jgi:hypothetical protein